jgi:glycosyltransferase involved in cell wall biosynthesis
MKVAIIGQTLNKNHADKISGGIQTVERLHVKIFLNEGWEVYFITPSCSEYFNDHEMFHLCKCSLPAQDECGELDRTGKTRHSRTLASDIQSWISEIDPDLIINHSFSSAHVRISTEFATKYPVMNFIHNTADTAMDIGVIAKVKFYLEMVKRGSSLVCVSEYQRETWRVALRKRLASGGDSFDFLKEEDIDKIYDPVCYPIFVSPPELQAPQKHLIVISRPDPIKNVSKLLELMVLAKIDAHLHIFLAHPGELDNNEYYTQKIKPHLDKLHCTLHHNAPRQELLDCLATARGCFIPCTVEAAPVAFLEAASYGVYSIVFAKEKGGVVDHAAKYLLPHNKIWEIINVSKKDEEAAADLKKAVDNMMTTDDLNLGGWCLSDFTCRIHSFEQRTKDLLKIADDTMKRYQKKPNLLDF